MLFSSWGSSSRLSCLVPHLCRSVVNRAVSRPVPPPRGIDLLSPTSSHQLTTLPSEIGQVATPVDFLKAIGRSSETKYTTEEDWKGFWATSGHTLKKSGVAIRDRRYILWCMEKYRSGKPIESFAHEPKPKKTVRGWGPSVQNGKRIRSRRLKNKK